MSVVNLATGKVAKSLPAGSDPYEMALSPDGKHSYVSNFDSSTVTEVGLTAHAADWSVSVPANPEDLALSPDGFLYVASYGTYMVSEINPSTRSVINSVNVGMPTFEIAISRP